MPAPMASCASARPAAASAPARRSAPSGGSATAEAPSAADLAPAAHAVQKRLHAGDVAGLAAVAVALEHRVRPVLGEVGEEVLDHRVGAAAVGAEQERVDVAVDGAGGRRAQRLAGAGPVHPLHARHVHGQRIAVRRQRQGPVGGDELVDAGVEHGVVDDVRLAGDQHHRVAVLARPRERAPADGVQAGLEQALSIHGGLVGRVERGRRERRVPGCLRQRAHGLADGSSDPRRVEPVAFLLEEHGPQHARGRALGVQRSPDHVRRALRHRARVRLRAGVGQRQVHEDRREEDVHVGAGQPVQQLDRRAGARRGAAPVALRQRVAPGAQHLRRGSRGAGAACEKNGSVSTR